MRADFKKMVAVALSVFNLLFCVRAVFAEYQEPELIYENETGMVTVRGNTSPLSKITIEILYPDKSSEDLIVFDPVTDKTDIFKDVRYLSEITAGADGSYETSFIFSADSGTYPVRIFLTDEGRIVDKKLIFISMEQIKGLVEEINQNPSRAEEIIENNMDILGLKNSAYEELKNAGMSLSQGYVYLSLIHIFIRLWKL